MKEQLFVRFQVKVLGAQDAFIGLLVKDKAEAGRLFGRHRLFEALHALQLLDAALRRRGGRRAHDVPIDEVLQFGNLLALLLVQALFLLALFLAQDAVLRIAALVRGQHAALQL